MNESEFINAHRPNKKCQLIVLYYRRCVIDRLIGSVNKSASNRKSNLKLQHSSIVGSCDVNNYLIWQTLRHQLQRRHQFIDATFTFSTRLYRGCSLVASVPKERREWTPISPRHMVTLIFDEYFRCYQCFKKIINRKRTFCTASSFFSHLHFITTDRHDFSRTRNS